MMRRVKAGILSLCMVLIMLLAQNPVSVLAASGTISIGASAGAVEQGQTVTVTVTLNGNGGTAGSLDANVMYDASLFDFAGGSGVGGGNGTLTISTWDTSGGTAGSLSVTMSFTAKSTGTGSFTVQNAEATDGTGTPLTVNQGAACSVQVNAPYVASGNNALASLAVGAGTLTPGFSPDNLNYTVTLPSYMSSLDIGASPADSRARVTSVSGNNPLREGANTVSIVVTAENGSARTYTITVNNPAAPTAPPTEAPDTTAAATETETVTEEVTETETETETESETEEESRNSSETVSVGGKNYSVAETFEEQLPEGFSQTFYAYNGKQVQIGQSSGGVMLMYLTDENGEGRFFVYDEETKEFTPYIPLNTRAQSYVWENKPDSVSVPAGYTETTITVDGQEITAWSNSEGSVLVYATSLDGKKGFYRYDEETGNLFPYQQDASSGEGYVDRDSYESLEAQYQQDHSKSVKVYIFLIILIVILLAAIVFLVVLLNKHRNGTDGGPEDPDDYEDEEEYEDYEDYGDEEEDSGYEELGEESEEESVSEEADGSDSQAAFENTGDIDLDSLSKALSDNIDMGEEKVQPKEKNSAGNDDFEFMDV